MMDRHQMEQRLSRIYAEMLSSMSKVFDAETEYDAIKNEYVHRVREQNRIPAGTPLPSHLAKLAEQNCDFDPRATQTMKLISYHSYRAQTLALTYQVVEAHMRRGASLL